MKNKAFALIRLGKPLITIILLTVLLPVLSGQNIESVKKNVIKMMNTGNTDPIGNSFQGLTEVKTPAFNGIVNDIKAKNIINDYLKANKPRNFEIKKEGTTGNGYYIIGNFISGGKKKIVYFLFKKIKSDFIVQQIEFE